MSRRAAQSGVARREGSMPRTLGSVLRAEEVNGSNPRVALVETRRFGQRICGRQATGPPGLEGSGNGEPATQMRLLCDTGHRFRGDGPSC